MPATRRCVAVYHAIACTLLLVLVPSGTCCPLTAPSPAIVAVSCCEGGSCDWTSFHPSVPTASPSLTWPEHHWMADAGPRQYVLTNRPDEADHHLRISLERFMADLQAIQLRI